MGPKELSKRCNMRNLEGAFVNIGWNVFEHHIGALHEKIKLHIKTNKAVNVGKRYEFVDLELIKIFDNLVN